LAAARGAAGTPVRVAVAPTRFAAWVAASGSAGPLSALPVSILAGRLGLRERAAADLVEAMGRLGIGTLGALAALSPARVADRFGPAGLRAHRLARGEEEPLRPRAPHEELAEEIELPEGTAGHLLDRALELLVDRLLAAPQRRGRTLLGLRLGARLSGGGSWSVEQGLGRPTASARVLRSLLTPRLEALPAPAVSLRLRALGLGPRVGDQLELTIRGEEARRRRLGAAVREVRAAQGGDALLKVLPIDPGSRVPERRAILTPYPEP
jgi:protein ImuB